MAQVGNAYVGIGTRPLRKGLRVLTTKPPTKWLLGAKAKTSSGTDTMAFALRITCSAGTPSNAPLSAEDIKSEIII